MESLTLDARRGRRMDTQCMSMCFLQLRFDRSRAILFSRGFNSICSSFSNRVALCVGLGMSGQGSLSFPLPQVSLPRTLTGSLSWPFFRHQKRRDSDETPRETSLQPLHRSSRQEHARPVSEAPLAPAAPPALDASNGLDVSLAGMSSSGVFPSMTTRVRLLHGPGSHKNRAMGARSNIWDREIIGVHRLGERHKVQNGHIPT